MSNFKSLSWAILFIGLATHAVKAQPEFDPLQLHGFYAAVDDECGTSYVASAYRMVVQKYGSRSDQLIKTVALKHYVGYEKQVKRQVSRLGSEKYCSMMAKAAGL
jgi:hypothetical protein